VCFARGRVDSRSPTFMPIYDPGSRPIEPGQTIAGDATISLPLVAQHYGAVGSVEPLERKPNEAVLRLGYFRSEPQWMKLPLAEGGSISVSAWTARMEILRSDIKPIP